ncbi:immunoglobulin domain-containing family protein [Horticoccus sp. 23ND18S-11]|uniref:hypothetical protein n=1 Tax=Horticoccus sp. 23ND18S-11 TaxID=3391832 RepID=UPI0039C9F610
MKLLSRTWPALLAVTASLALAQSPIQPAVGVMATTANSQRGETSVTLDVGFGIRAVPASRVTVPSGEALRVTAPKLGDGISYLWTKNGRALPGASSNVLTIPHVVADDAGTYACLFSTPTTLPQPSQTLVLGVGPTDRLINLSTRGTVAGGGGASLVSGLVIGASGTGKKLIIRAVGPSLSLFGVTNPLRTPVLRIFDASGRPYENGYAYPAVVGGPTYESDLAESLARTGAFPLPAGTRDVVTMLPFVAGSYTVQVTSGDTTGGEVLLEIYEVP